MESKIKESVEMKLIKRSITTAFKNKGYTLKYNDDLIGCADYLIESMNLNDEYTLDKYILDTIDNYPEMLKKL